MRLIKETKNVGSDVYERTVGCTLNLHELLEKLEDNFTYFTSINIDGDTFFVNNPIEYEVFVSGKPVDASKIIISLYNTEDDKSESWVCEASGDELDTDNVTEAQALTKMSKEELIAEVMRCRNY